MAISNSWHPGFPTKIAVVCSSRHQVIQPMVGPIPIFPCAGMKRLFGWWNPHFDFPKIGPSFRRPLTWTWRATCRWPDSVRFCWMKFPLPFGVIFTRLGKVSISSSTTMYWWNPGLAESIQCVLSNSLFSCLLDRFGWSDRWWTITQIPFPCFCSLNPYSLFREVFCFGRGSYEKFAWSKPRIWLGKNRSKPALEIVESGFIPQSFGLHAWKGRLEKKNTGRSTVEKGIGNSWFHMQKIDSFLDDIDSRIPRGLPNLGPTCPIFFGLWDHVCWLTGTDGQYSFTNRHVQGSSFTWM